MRSLPALKLFAHAVILLLFFSFLSCKESAPEDAPDKVLDANLLRSEKEFREILTARTSGPGRTFSIENVTRVGSNLNIHLKGGCSADLFKVVWDGLILESHPAQVRLVIVNEAAENCNSSEQHTVTIDLAKIIGNADVKDFVFHVANGSTKQDASIDPNGVVQHY